MDIKSRIKTLDEIEKLKKKSMALSRQRAFNNEGFETYTNKLFEPIVKEEKRTREQVQETMTANNQALVQGQQKLTDGLKNLGQLQIALAEKRGEIMDTEDPYPDPPMEGEEDVTEEGPKIEDITSNVLINGALKLFKNNQDKGANTTIHISRDEKDTFYIGKNTAKLTIVDNDFYLDKSNKRYPITEGLVRLLFSDGTHEDYSKEPYYERDALHYADIVAHSNVGKLVPHFGKSNKALMLQQYLKPYRKGGVSEIRTGSGLKKEKRLVQNRNKGIDLIVATSPDELIDKLSLLLASIEAGNTSTTTHNKVVAIGNYLFDKGHINKSTYVSIINELDRI